MNRGFWNVYFWLISSSETKYNKNFHDKQASPFRLSVQPGHVVCVTISQAQTNFVDVQKSSMRVSSIFNKLEDSVQKQFEK